MTARFTLSRRDRRAVMVGALLLVPALAWRLVLQPYVRARSDLSARVSEQRALLARELAVVGAARRMTSDLRRAQRQFATRQARLLPGREPLAATGTLVTLVGDEARRSAVLLNAVASRQPEPAAGGLVGVRIEMRGRSDLQGLLEWLGALEAGARLLRVDALTVTGGPEVLRVGAVIRGYVRGTEGAQ